MFKFLMNRVEPEHCINWVFFAEIKNISCMFFQFDIVEHISISNIN